MVMSAPSSSLASPTRHSNAPTCCAGERLASICTLSTAHRPHGRSWVRCMRPSPGSSANRRRPGPPEAPPRLFLRMPEFEYNGHTLTYDEYGAGDRPIILIHGLLMSRRMFDRLGPAMAARGNRVIAIDLLGHGRSDRPTEMSNYSLTFFARQVEALMDHLEMDQAVIGGTSLGANVTLELSYLSPDRVRGMMIEMPVLDNALLAVAVIFTPIMLGLRFGEPVLKLLASAARRIPRTNPLIDMGLDVIRQDPAPSMAVLEELFLGSSA